MNIFKSTREFVVVDKHQVDERRWKNVKSKDNLHVYTERPRKKIEGMGGLPENYPSENQELNNDAGTSKGLPIMLSVGTFVGEMADLMFGVVNPTLDIMRIKASYVHDLDSASVLCSVVEPSEEEPFRSLVIKWMTIDVPLQSTNLRKITFCAKCMAEAIKWNALEPARDQAAGYEAYKAISTSSQSETPDSSTYDLIWGNLE
ncbi:unnamed protein product [Phytophthora fragariaefolia]|uniref:Unnamed protein product n=1 Tax=Phytophthora fragariaefolia TaxID=1490495 RepID=A0A9W6XKP8_9STRA|nr:unnamed protein product [Phytophthora fragariaefolia]